MKLSPHFSLTELTRSSTAAALGLDNTPAPEVVPRLIRTAEMLERIRTALGVPVTVTSGYRAPAVNRAVTLNTSGARPGMTVRIIRNGGDSAGPWSLSIGATGKSLLARQWCDVIYNGSYWIVTASGAL